MLIRGWMTVPKITHKNQKFPVLVMLPGYQADTKPLLGADEDMIFVSADVRGQGLNRTEMDLRRDQYIVYDLENKNKYYLRGVIMDCLRYIDFVCSRPEIDKQKIAVAGGSMGGYSSITTAALDKRVALCAPQNPFMSDVYNMDNGASVWPLQHMKRYVAIRPGLTFDKVLDNLQYFDTKNFATMIKCPVLMGIGLLDPYVPPNNSFAVFNNINAKKKIIVFKDLGHEVGKKYMLYEERWMRDQFAMF
jgi:cephalosporin-C deacetylase